MLRKKLLLDCTLRDGGYVNDWEFGNDCIVEIFERLVSSNVDIIEIGFLDERRPFDINRTIMPDTESVNKIFGTLDKGNSLVVAMIDYGTCSLDNIQDCQDCYLDGIRVIFKEQLMHEALEYCRQLKKKGYKVFSQMVSVTTYTDDKLKEYAQLVNSVKPFGNAMVDTYGLLHADGLIDIFNKLNKYLDQEIVLAYHAHNNFQLGYANSIDLLGVDANRTIMVDGTLYGMGKSAGNAPLELLAMHMNEKYGSNYDISQMLEAIENNIIDIYRRQQWGYNLFFYIASMTKCHPNYVSFLMNKKTLSIKQIKEILLSIEPEKCLLYDLKYAEQMYLDYQSIECDDRATLQHLTQNLKNRSVLLLGPGNSIKREKNKIKTFIQDNDPIIISVNYVPKDIKVAYVFLTNSKRYTQLLSDLNNSNGNNEVKIIATSNVTKTAGKFDCIISYSSLIDKDTEIIDNSLIMLLKAMMSVGVKKVSLAGFDGYSRRSDNYFDISREYSFAKEKASYLNEYVIDFLSIIRKQCVEVNFVTKSYYEK